LKSGQPYEVRLVLVPCDEEPTHQALHPFGQIPTYEEAILSCSKGAIVFLSPSAMQACCRTMPMPGTRDHMDVAALQHSGADDP